MKKLAIAVLAVLFVAPAAMAEGWGVGLKLGGGRNNPKDLKDAHEFGTTLDKNAAYFGLEVLHEWSLCDEANKIGFKVEWDAFGENKLKGWGWDITEETHAFPFTLYYKRDNGVGGLSWFGGAGVTIMHSKLEGKGLESFSWGKNRAIPHIVLGGEYRFTKVFALGVEARYNFAAKVTKKVEGEQYILSDRGGLGAALTGRFYF